MVVGINSGLVLFFSMKVAVCCAEDDVKEVIRAVDTEAVSHDDRWTTAVAQPASRLATHTMSKLSEGWGRGTALGALCCMLSSLKIFFDLVHQIETEPLETLSLMVLTRRFGAMVVTGLAPLLLAKDLARVSSLCDDLTERINRLRLEWRSTAEATEIHNRTFPLLTTLRVCNHNQG